MEEKLVGKRFKGKQKITERVSYKGQLRIVGVVLDNNEEITGYAIMNEKDYRSKMYTVEQTMLLIKKFKFVNAEISSEKDVEITDCSGERLPVYDKKGCAQNHKVNGKIVKRSAIIVARVFIDGDKKGYRVLFDNREVSNLSEKDLISLCEIRDIFLVNAKIVGKEGYDKYISSIRSEFVRIDVTKDEMCLMEKERKHSKEEARKYINGRHVEKLRKSLLIIAVNITGPYREQSIRKSIANNACGMCSNKYVDGSRVYDIKKEINILIDEVLPFYGVSGEKIKQLKRLVHGDSIENGNHVYRGIPEGQMRAMISICDAMMENEEFRKEFTERITKRRSWEKGVCFRNKVIREFFEYYRAEIGTMSNMEKMKEKYLSDSGKNKSAIDVRNTFNEELRFNSSKECAEIGFAMTKGDAGRKYRTSSGSVLTLKYLKNNVALFNEIMEDATCLGDILIPAQIEKVLDCYDSQVNRAYQEEMRFNERSQREYYAEVVEIMITVWAIYNPQLATKYRDLMTSRGVEALKGTLEGINPEEYVDYGLSEEIRMYYESGFTCFLNDHSFRPKYADRLKAKYVNYRGAFGNQKRIESDLINKELATIVKMLSSDRVESDVVDKHIGSLRNM